MIIIILVYIFKQVTVTNGFADNCCPWREMSAGEVWGLKAQIGELQTFSCGKHWKIKLQNIKN